ncbi:hypothetical protein RRG08_023528 [Elysia crispata]|uniref:Uncharacterized protein n=1 Tax=Elysia crispata TaxID=231223 RepID=A0AAE1BD31_9GAST|nr:hypothetical protein RRG08_023528 [Elysia crispata]
MHTISFATPQHFGYQFREVGCETVNQEQTKFISKKGFLVLINFSKKSRKREFFKGGSAIIQSRRLQALSATTSQSKLAPTAGTSAGWVSNLHQLGHSNTGYVRIMHCFSLSDNNGLCRGVGGRRSG